MSKRLLALLLAGTVCLAGFSLAQEPAGQEEPPVRLKKKKPRGDDKPKAEPEKPEEKKKDEKKDDKKAEPREVEPVTPQEEEKEVLQRVVKNVHSVEERLAKNDLGEATQQTQRDILKDIESLIQQNENDQSNGGEEGGGEADKNQSQQGGDGQQDQKQQAGRGKKSKKKSIFGSKWVKRRRTVSKSRVKQRPSGDQRAAGGGKEGEKPGGRDGKGGNGGGGGNKDDRARNRAADQYKDVWGHLPETLRAQMDAYSNPQPFMPKYDDLIKRYYRTIAEQGRRKGE